jgi:alpha-glucosidase
MWIGALLVSGFARAATLSPNECSSGDGRLVFSLQLKGDLFYQVDFAGKHILKPSRLGFDFLRSSSTPKSPIGVEVQDEWQLGPLKLASTSRVHHHDSFDVPVGKTSHIDDDDEQCTFHLVERASPNREMDLEVRVFSEGLGFRYRFPKQKNMADFVIGQERTAFALGADAQLFALPLPFNSPFEAYYQSGPLKDFTADQTLALPLMMQLKNHLWIALTEAALTDYAGMYVVHTHDHTLETRLAPAQDNPAVKVKGVPPFSTPWRVILISKDPGSFLQSNMITSLNEPSQLGDVSWIHPGKVQFPWWSSYLLPDADPGEKDPSRRPGLNTWTFKKYIDFCAQNGIEAHSIDGLDLAWYGGPTSKPDSTVDVTKSIPEVDVQDILRYAKSKGVKTRLWMHQQALFHRDLDSVFATYEKWGVEGIMIDFLNRDDQEMVRFYTDAIRKAAAHHLTINFHGIWKPTGVERTYPNLLAHEGIWGTEYDKWAKNGCPPEHQMIAAFVRGLAGAAEIHPGSFNPILPQDFHPEPKATRAQGTLARQLALYVVFYSNVPMLVDTPFAYTSRPTPFQFVKALPATWDETKVLYAEVPKAVSIARRHGRDWFIGSLTDRKAQQIELSLQFLGKGSFVAEVYSDGPEARKEAGSLDFKAIPVTAESKLKLRLAPSGGNAIRISPAKSDANH